MKENERVGNSGNIDSEVTGTPVVSESAIGEITLSVSILRKTGGWFPRMHWGLEHSAGHYIDLVAAIGGLSLFPIGYLFGALKREVA
jgi:hypothetical protein